MMVKSSKIYSLVKKYHAFQARKRFFGQYLKLLIDEKDVNGLCVFVDEVCEFAKQQADKALNAEDAPQENYKLMKQQIHNCLKRFDQIVPALQTINDDNSNQSKVSDQMTGNKPTSQMNSDEIQTNKQATITESLNHFRGVTFFRKCSGETDFDIDIEDPQQRRSPISPGTEPGSC